MNSVNEELIERADKIAERLRWAALAKLHPFGVDGHRFQINPRLPVETLASVEAKFGITFPVEYATYIIRVANGGAGPGYGLHSLDQALRGFTEFGGDDYLRRPFQHTEAININEIPEVVALSERISKGELSDAEVADLETGEPAWYDLTGVLSLCDIGCDLSHFLVISGPTRGQIWLNGRRGLVPFRLNFLDWYDRWLDHILAGGDGVWWND